MGSKLFVGNLDFKTTQAEIESLFAQVGPIQEVFLPFDRVTSRPRGFAFVEYQSEADAEQAIARFNGHELGGRQLRVNAAEARPPRPGGGGGSGGGYSPDARPAFAGAGKPKGSRRNLRARKRSL